jgi:hypothetical protein
MGGMKRKTTKPKRRSVSKPVKRGTKPRARTTRKKPQQKRTKAKKATRRRTRRRKQSKAVLYQGNLFNMSCGGGERYAGNGFSSVRNLVYAGQVESFEIAKNKIIRAAQRASKFA